VLRRYEAPSKPPVRSGLLRYFIPEGSESLPNYNTGRRVSVLL